MALRFGTDGLRGQANAELTPEVAVAVGRAACRVLGFERVVVGRDTRRSGTMLEAALSAGLASEGATVLAVGVLPTPGLAYLADAWGVPAAVVSASHNPYADNGIKLFSGRGGKLDAEVEAEIARVATGLLAVPAASDPGGRPVGDRVGDVVGTADEATAAYLAHLVAALDGRRLEGLRVALDCANGATTWVAPEAFRRLGAEVVVCADQPNGLNINEECGSTDPRYLGRVVVATGCDLGLAFDGDGDRVVAVDEAGRVVDGDEIMALLADDLHRAGTLGGAVVVTVMSNLGLHRALRARGIEVIETPVGDRHVLRALEERALALGGEQSGHIILRRRATTGDGILTGATLAELVQRRARPLSELARAAMERLPQLHRSVRVSSLDGLGEAAAVWEAVEAARRGLGDDGRVLVRASGTEPVVRVMVEASSEELAERVADELVACILDVLG